MTRTVSRGFLTDPKGVSHEYDVPILDPLLSSQKVLVEGSLIWDSAFVLENNVTKIQIVEVTNPFRAIEYRFVSTLNGFLSNSKVHPSLEKAKEEYEAFFTQNTGVEWRSIPLSLTNASTFLQRQQTDVTKARVVRKVYDVKLPENSRELDRKASKMEERVLNFVQTISDLETIRKTMAKAGIDWQTTPLGRVSSSTLEKGFAILGEIEKGLQTVPLDLEALNELSKKLNTLVPDVPGAGPIHSTELLRRRMRKLEGLRDLGTAVDLVTCPPGLSKGIPRLDAIYNGICTDIRALEMDHSLSKNLYVRFFLLV